MVATHDLFCNCLVIKLNLEGMCLLFIAISGGWLASIRVTCKDGNRVLFAGTRQKSSQHRTAEKTL